MTIQPKVKFLAVRSFSIFHVTQCIFFDIGDRNNHTFFDFWISGYFGARALFILPTIVQSQRASVLGNLHTHRNARDQRVRRTRRHQRFHVHTFDGYEIYTC